MIAAFKRLGLHKDIAWLIWSKYLDKTYRFAIYAEATDSIDAIKFSDNYSLQIAKYGHVHLVDWALRHGCKWDLSFDAHAALYGHLALLQISCPHNKSALVCADAALGGHLEILQWLRANDYPWAENTCSSAAEGGHLEILKWARTNGCRWNYVTCLFAAEYGHLDILIWARSGASGEICDWNENVCELAAENGHFEVLKWARANGCPIYEEIYENAANGGNLEILQWLRDPMVALEMSDVVHEWPSGICDWAIMDSSRRKTDAEIITMIKYIRREGGVWDEETCDVAMESGRIEVLRWLLDNGCPYYRDITHNACYFSNIKMIQWLLERFPESPLNDNACMAAVQGGQLHVLQWLVNQGLKCGDAVLQAAINGKKVNIVEYLQR